MKIINPTTGNEVQITIGSELRYDLITQRVRVDYTIKEGENFRKDFYFLSQEETGEWQDDNIFMNTIIKVNGLSVE